MPNNASENNRRIAKNTVALYIRSIIVLLIALYTSRVCLDALGFVDYGLYNVIGGFVLMFSFLNNALSVGTQRFLTYELGTSSDVNNGFTEVFNASCYLHFGVAVVIVLLSETLGLWFVLHKLVIPAERLSAALWVYHSSVLVLFVSVVRVPFMSAIVAYEKMGVFAFFCIAESVMKLVVVFVLYMFSVDRLKLYAILLFVSSITITALYGMYCARWVNGCKIRRTLSFQTLKKITVFFSWNLFGSLALIGQSQGLNVLLNMFFGVVVNAARGIAYQISAAINQLISSFVMAATPQITKRYASGNVDGALNLMSRISKFSFYLFFIFSYPLFLLMDVVLRLWLVEVPDYTLAFSRLILIIAAIDILGYPIASLIQATGRIKTYQLVVSCILLLNIPLSYVSLRKGGEPYVVFYWSIACSILALCFRVYMLRSRMSFSLRAYWDKVLRPILYPSFFCIAILFVFRFSLSGDEALPRFSLLCLGLFGFICLVYMIGMTVDERNFIKNRVMNVYRRKNV